MRFPFHSPLAFWLSICVAFNIYFDMKKRQTEKKKSDVINKKYINHSIPKDPLATSMVNNCITNILSFVFDH
jgi:hypothetical protein